MSFRSPQLQAKKGQARIFDRAIVRLGEVLINQSQVSLIPKSSASMSNVHEFRMSFIWVEAWPDLLVPNASAPFAVLGRSAKYAAEVDQLVAGGTSTLSGLTLPWIPKWSKSFWTLYLGGPVDGLPGTKAWNHVVPLRGAPPAKITAPWLDEPGRVWSESYFYPHGVAYVFNATCRGRFTIRKGVMEAAWRILDHEKYDVIWQDGTKEQLPLPALGAKAMSSLRFTSLGRQPVNIESEHRVFSVASIVKASNDISGFAAADGDEVHATLEGLTGWNANFWTPPGTPLASHSLNIHNPSPQNILYANRRGRGVWLPTWFVPSLSSGKPRQKIGCYHRNLTMSSLQLESMALLCKLAHGQSAPGNAPGGTYRDLCKRAAEVLGRMHGGVRSTYRSSSTPRHIDDNSWRAAINGVRQWFGLSNLSP
jgi:hypothetical protein